MRQQRGMFITNINIFIIKTKRKRKQKNSTVQNRIETPNKPLDT